MDLLSLFIRGVFFLGRKKKYFFLILLVGLFTAFCVSSSICYATTDNIIITENEYDIIKTMPNICYVTQLGYSSVSDYHVNQVLNGLNSVTSSDFCTFWNSTVLDEISDYGLASYNLTKTQLTFQFINTGYDYNCKLRVFISNNQIGNNLGFLRMTNYQSVYYSISAYDDYIYYFDVDIDSGSISMSSIDFLDSRSGGSDYSYNYIDIEDSIIDVNGVCGFYGIQTLYYNDLPYIIKYSVSEYLVEPDPEPDNSGDIGTGTTGNIYDNSGDKTGSIDLTNIENGIGNINSSINEQGQAIIENQNENTETIVNTISGEVNKITNILTDEPNLEDINITSGDIQRSFRFRICRRPL